MFMVRHTVTSLYRHVPTSLHSSRWSSFTSSPVTIIQSTTRLSQCTASARPSPSIIPPNTADPLIIPSQTPTPNLHLPILHTYPQPFFSHGSIKFLRGARTARVSTALQWMVLYRIRGTLQV